MLSRKVPNLPAHQLKIYNMKKEKQFMKIRILSSLLTMTSFSFKGWSDKEKEGTFVSWKGEAMSFEMFETTNNDENDCVKCKKDDATWEHTKCSDKIAYACRAGPGRF